VGRDGRHLVHLIFFNTRSVIAAAVLSVWLNTIIVVVRTRSRLINVFGFIFSDAVVVMLSRS